MNDVDEPVVGLAEDRNIERDLLARLHNPLLQTFLLQDGGSKSEGNGDPLEGRQYFGIERPAPLEKVRKGAAVEERAGSAVRQAGRTEGPLQRVAEGAPPG